jgi:hypothetical protein
VLGLGDADLKVGTTIAVGTTMAACATMAVGGAALIFR